MEKELRNRGYSLVELIVVVLIMAILTGGTTVGISALRNASASQAAKKLDAEIAYARNLAMTASELGGASAVTLVVLREGDSFYAEVRRGATVMERNKLGGDRIAIKAGPAGSSSLTCPYEVDEGRELTITFEKRAGGVASTAPGGSGTARYLDIYVEGGTTVHILIAGYTGRTFVEEE